MRGEGSKLDEGRKAEPGGSNRGRLGKLCPKARLSQDRLPRESV